jgi:hypothetical protein
MPGAAVAPLGEDKTKLERYSERLKAPLLRRATWRIRQDEQRAAGAVATNLLGKSIMTVFKYDHVHLRSPDPEATRSSTKICSALRFPAVCIRLALGLPDNRVSR